MTKQKNEQGAVKAAEGVVWAAYRRWRRIIEPITPGHVTLVLGAAIFALAGGGVDHFLLKSPPPSNPSNVAKATSIGSISSGDGKLLGIDDGRLPDVGVINNVTITAVSDQSRPDSPTGHTYMITVNFPNPEAHCDDQCTLAVEHITGSKCIDPVCTAQFWNVDEGDKKSSGLVQADAQNYKDKKQKVLIVFSGKRNLNYSRYANILLLGAQ